MLNRLKNYILDVIVKVIMLVELFLKIIMLKLGEVNLEKGVIRNYDYKSDLGGCYKSDYKSDYENNLIDYYKRDHKSDYKDDYEDDYEDDYK